MIKIFCIIAIIISGCCQNVIHDKKLDFHIYKLNVLDSIQTELTYEQGVLVEVRHNKKGSKNYTMNTYSFNTDGSLGNVYKVVGDTILELVFFYPNSRIKEIVRIKELNPHSVKYTFHGFQEEYYETGLLKEKYKCFNGKRQDTLKQYDISGKLKSFEIYDKGESIKKVDL